MKKIAWPRLTQNMPKYAQNKLDELPLLGKIELLQKWIPGRHEYGYYSIPQFDNLPF